MKAVILAGGLGSRLKPFTEVIPKPLLPVGKKAVLEVQIERLKSYGFDEVYLATNYKSEYIENFFGNGNKYGIQLFISKEEKPLGTAGPLKLLSDEFDEPFLVMNGDILTLMNFKKFYEYAVKEYTKAGYEQYEVSNYAQRGRECRHNIKYWQSEEYFAFGPSAHGYVDGVRYANFRSIGKYVKYLKSGKLPIDSEELIDRKQQIYERLYLELRAKGLRIDKFNKDFSMLI